MFKIPPQYLVIGIILFLAAYGGMFYHFGTTAEKLECTDDKLDVVTDTMEATVEAIVEHDEDVVEIREHRTTVEAVTHEAETAIFNIPSLEDSGSDCPVSDFVGLQQSTYSAFPTGLFLQ